MFSTTERSLPSPKIQRYLNKTNSRRSSLSRVLYNKMKRMKKMRMTMKRKMGLKKMTIIFRGNSRNSQVLFNIRAKAKKKTSHLLSNSLRMCSNRINKNKHRMRLKKRNIMRKEKKEGKMMNMRMNEFIS
jgi:hypothetical protein